MRRLPAYFRQQGRIKPPTSKAATRTAAHAIALIKHAGGTVEADNPGPGGARRWKLNFGGWSHGGVPDEGLIHIANEHARTRAHPKT